MKETKYLALKQNENSVAVPTLTLSETLSDKAHQAVTKCSTPLLNFLGRHKIMHMNAVEIVQEHHSMYRISLPPEHLHLLTR
jgi:hypothetical protein